MRSMALSRQRTARGVVIMTCWHLARPVRQNERPLADDAEILSRRTLVRNKVRKSGVQEGLVPVSAMHLTASVDINDPEPGLLADDDRFVAELGPRARPTGTMKRAKITAMPISNVS